MVLQTRQGPWCGRGYRPGAGELSAGGPGAQGDEGRGRTGAGGMVRRSQRRKLSKFTGRCRGEEGLRVRGTEKGRAVRW